MFCICEENFIEWYFKGLLVTLYLRQLIFPFIIRLQPFLGTISLPALVTLYVSCFSEKSNYYFRSIECFEVYDKNKISMKQNRLRKWEQICCLNISRRDDQPRIFRLTFWKKDVLLEFQWKMDNPKKQERPELVRLGFIRNRAGAIIPLNHISSFC